jgi:hypothetical protein
MSVAGVVAFVNTLQIRTPGLRDEQPAQLGFRPWLASKEIRVYPDRIERGHESHPLIAVTADAHGTGPTCGITISGPDFAWSPKVNSSHMSAAHKFAAQVRQAVNAA